jgi:hypothetical protein
MAEMVLITGVPGDGKSLLAITKGLEFVKQGRTVYAAGFKELNYEATGFKPLPTPFESFDPANTDELGRVMPDWMLLEGSVIMYDECYDVMPTRAAGKVPVHIEALARHRHYNIDLIFVSQKHNQIDSFVKGLIKVHIHVKRRFGLNAAWLKTWDEFQENTKSESCLVKPIWRYPKKNYALYKSATAHSIKKSFPWYFYALPIMMCVVGVSVWYSIHRFKQTMGVSAQDAPAAGAEKHIDQRAGDNTSAEDVLRHKDYAAWLRPRIAGQPVTAPAYDQLTVQGVPQLYCIAVDDGRCSCLTEQGTRYVVQPKLCRVMAVDGVYNPFLPPANRQQDTQQHREEPRAAVPSDGVASVAGEPVAAGGLHAGGISQSYTPPEYQQGNQ